MEAYVAMALTALGGAWIGSFLGAYLKKKGENIALQEDIEKLVAQVEAVTQATKAIEAKISNEMWERQKRWEIKRDGIVEAIKELASVEDSLRAMYILFLISQKAGEPDSQQMVQQKTDAIIRWNQASLAFQRAKLLASIACGSEVNLQFGLTAGVLQAIASDVMAGEIGAYTTRSQQIAEEITTLVTAIRKEFRVDETSPF